MSWEKKEISQNIPAAASHTSYCFPLHLHLSLIMSPEQWEFSWTILRWQLPWKAPTLTFSVWKEYWRNKVDSDINK